MELPESAFSEYRCPKTRSPAAPFPPTRIGLRFSDEDTKQNSQKFAGKSRYGHRSEGRRARDAGATPVRDSLLDGVQVQCCSLSALSAANCRCRPADTENGFAQGPVFEDWRGGVSPAAGSPGLFLRRHPRICNWVSGV